MLGDAAHDIKDKVNLNKIQQQARSNKTLLEYH